jgi:lipid II:glycine glycyltransferase (peptidoglycan interpeptide bridge formation enzyme)
VFYWGGHAVYWHGAAHEDALQLRPTHVLHAAIIKDACARGYRYYDFNPSGGLEGVARFKAGFGTELVPFRRYAYESPWIRGARRVRGVIHWIRNRPSRTASGIT